MGSGKPEPADESKCAACGEPQSSARERETKRGPQLVCSCGYVYSEASRELRERGAKKGRASV